METINDRLKLIVNERHNGNMSEFGRAIGVLPTVMSNIIRGRKSKPSCDILEKIAISIKDINLRWLLTGSGEPFYDNLNKQFDNDNLLEIIKEKDKQIEKLLNLLENK